MILKPYLISKQSQRLLNHATIVRLSSRPFFYSPNAAFNKASSSLPLHPFKPFVTVFHSQNFHTSSIILGRNDHKYQKENNDMNVEARSNDFEYKKKIMKLEQEIETLQLSLEEEKKKNKEKQTLPSELIQRLSDNAPIFFIYWISMYTMSGIGLYYALEMGLFNGGDEVNWFKESGIADWVDASNHENSLVAIELNQSLEFIRTPFTVATTPLIKRAWKKIRS